MPERPWNINIHYDGLLDSMVSPQARRVLDVGCGDGFLAARLSRHAAHVTAVDADAPVLQRARARFANAPVEWLQGDIMTVELPTGRFDAVVSNAALHHLEDTFDAYMSDSRRTALAPERDRAIARTEVIHVDLG